MESPISRRSLLNYAAIVILLAGMGTGEFIYWRSIHSGSGAGNVDSSVSPEAARVYELDVQRNVGTFGLIVDQWSQSFAKLGEPGPLAITISILSMLAAGGCFMAASRMPHD